TTQPAAFSAFEIAAPMPRVPPVTTATRAMTSSVPDGSKQGTGGGSFRRLTSIFRPLPLHAHCNAHAAADAQRGEAFFCMPFLHLVEQRHQHAGARRPDRMAQRNRAAVDVDLVGVPAEVLVDRAGLGRERLVRLDQIEVLDLPARLLERCAR